MLSVLHTYWNVQATREIEHEQKRNILHILENIIAILFIHIICRTVGST